MTRKRRLAAAAVVLALLFAAAAGATSAPSRHSFPVNEQWSTRGPVGEFGAPRDGGRIHQGFDIVAKCGAKLLAVSEGQVIKRGFDPVLYGNYLLLSGAGEGRSYFYAHLLRRAVVKPGQHVFGGQYVGNEGRTGNAETVGCHLHFELRIRGRAVDPEPALRKWDRHSQPALDLRRGRWSRG
ncbi:MAG: M23 family metallopeptidase [Solirubrobacterales bacterium]